MSKAAVCSSFTAYFCAQSVTVEGSPEDDVAVLVFLRGGAVKPRLSCPMELARFEQALIWLRRRAAAAPTTAEQFLQTAFAALDPSGT
ncbi:unnamed protein product [Sphagnum jensenii]|uniref:Uncharacterized protein n=1 Tax=Sphagnum jensenii TaxID=128206 RepID=A0ABP0XIW7_9BRYO